MISAKKARKLTELTYRDENNLENLTKEDKEKIKEIEQLVIQVAQERQHYCIYLNDISINSPILPYLRSFGYIVYAELNKNNNDYVIVVRW